MQGVILDYCTCPGVLVNVTCQTVTARQPKCERMFSFFLSHSRKTKPIAVYGVEASGHATRYAFNEEPFGTWFLVQLL